ncbi:ABC transporter ATP-binding protein [Mycolicibacterium pyrenivorans]|uniref:ABC transporter ATP-binding protein n=1 Tax=Mycolicibacterium pyrenivorans TaxID=187102 RepID=UPI0021F33EC8|nr:ATP-binding cassette domain-containing protein [Mycolicibacterium pyrenivorans]MCV7155417.1 ATP-binding cassette domain-containing protein [Mycolicibacterium pyrenivorans]
MIEIIGLTKTFGGSPAVDDVTVTFPASSVTALLGLNGAGKTTLLRGIAGLDRPDGGTVTVCGQQPCGDPRLVGVHLGPGALNPRHTVWRHLCWVAALAGIDTARVTEALVETGLSGGRAERIGSLSLGARQRLAIAGALLGAPRALLFDEPLNGLDVPGIIWFRGLLRRLADRGCTVVVATHMLGEVVLSADRITVLDRGRLRVAGALDDAVPADAAAQQWLESTLMGCA